MDPTEIGEQHRALRDFVASCEKGTGKKTRQYKKLAFDVFI